jgi:hypothetical protein
MGRRGLTAPRMGRSEAIDALAWPQGACDRALLALHPGQRRRLGPINPWYAGVRMGLRGHESQDTRLDVGLLVL